MFGSVTNLVILKNSHCFDKRTCFYLQALSVTDMLYLTFMIGYLVAMKLVLTINYYKSTFSRPKFPSSTICILQITTGKSI